MGERPDPGSDRRASYIESIARGLTVTAGVALFAMMVTMTIHVVGRKLGHPVPGAFEISEQLMMVVFAFPLAEITRRKDHITFELVSDRFPPALRKWMAIAGALAGLVVFAPLAWQAWRIALEMYAMGEYRQGMVNVPIWPFRVLLAIGLTLFSVQLAVNCIAHIRRSPAPKPASGRQDVAAPSQVA
jgi:TRAP-type C4-dicarboxylate transport system permease small subunit